MGYIVKKVKVLTPNLEIKELYNKDLDFHYRTSFFKKNSGYIILEVTINLKKGDKKEILEIINDRKKRRLESQPLEFPSAGSVFRNPKDLFAGKLIEDLNLKGYQIGGAQVSEKHANFIINVGNATGKDIVGLINYIKEKVKEKYQIDLVLEQEIVK
jgi:UDP-N-acetylmuramate dehydrogenase